VVWSFAVIYNNSKYTVLSDSLFYVVYRYYLNFFWNFTEPEGRLTEEVPAAKQRAKTLKLIRIKL
jgi:hypothetical protein